MRYQIYINSMQDEVGRLTGMMDGYRVGDRMDLADAGDIEDADNQDVLNDLWRMYNVAHPAGYRNRSLSIGGVVVLGLGTDGVRAYAVARVGFEKLEAFEYQVPSVPGVIGVPYWD